MEPLQMLRKRLCRGSEQLVRLIHFPSAFARYIIKSSVEGGSKANY